MLRNVVAIVEEDAALFRLLDRLLTIMGRRTIRVAPDGNARAILQRTRPGLLIVDTGRAGPEMTTLLRQVRASPKLSDTPVIVCTSDEGLVGTMVDDFAERGWQLLRLPFEMEQLLNLIDDATQRTSCRSMLAA